MYSKWFVCIFFAFYIFVFPVSANSVLQAQRLISTMENYFMNYDIDAQMQQTGNHLRNQVNLFAQNTDKFNGLNAATKQRLAQNFRKLNLLLTLSGTISGCGDGRQNSAILQAANSEVLSTPMTAFCVPNFSRWQDLLSSELSLISLSDQVYDVQTFAMRNKLMDDLARHSLQSSFRSFLYHKLRYEVHSIEKSELSLDILINEYCGHDQKNSLKCTNELKNIFPNIENDFRNFTSARITNAEVMVGLNKNLNNLETLRKMAVENSDPLSRLKFQAAFFKLHGQGDGFLLRTKTLTDAIGGQRMANTVDEMLPFTMLDNQEIVNKAVNEVLRAAKDTGTKAITNLTSNKPVNWGELKNQIVRDPISTGIAIAKDPALAPLVCRALIEINNSKANKVALNSTLDGWGWVIGGATVFFGGWTLLAAKTSAQVAGAAVAKSLLQKSILAGIGLGTTDSVNTGVQLYQKHNELSQIEEVFLTDMDSQLVNEVAHQYSQYKSLKIRFSLAAGFSLADFGLFKALMPVVKSTKNVKVLVNMNRALASVLDSNQLTTLSKAVQGLGQAGTKIMQDSLNYIIQSDAVNLFVRSLEKFKENTQGLVLFLQRISLIGRNACKF